MADFMTSFLMSDSGSDIRSVHPDDETMANMDRHTVEFRKFDTKFEKSSDRRRVEIKSEH